ncbi:MAG: TAT-variant-translocated molybdopterin oxidoreductase [Candidatus Eisenbacteria bacterium]
MGAESSMENGYWRSLGELADTPEYREMLAREFPEGAADTPGPFSRRRFLQLMSASVALAGFSGCRWPKEEIVPYAHRPEGVTPGVARRFATSRNGGGYARALVVTSYDGRPVKVEGNGLDPVGRGATNAHDQAMVLGLYDPDRSRTLIRRQGGQEVSAGWDEFVSWAEGHFGSLRTARGEGLYVLAEPSSSIVLGAAFSRLQKAMPSTRFFEWDPLSRDGEREGARLVFGRPLRPRISLDRADVILALDADLFGDHPEGLRLSREFAGGRRVEEERMNRLYSVESVPSITGSMADHRLPLESGRIGAFALALAAEMVHGIGVEADDSIGRALAGRKEDYSFPARFLGVLAKDLAEHRGRSVIAAGPRQPEETHAAVWMLNSLLENVGKTVTAEGVADPDRPSHTAAIRTLARDLEAGKVRTLLVLGGNPAYDAPADLRFAELLGKAGTSVHLSTHRDETSRLCTWHLHRAHDLETWDIGLGADGSTTASQPLIEPLYGGRTPAEIVSLASGDPNRKAYDLAREAAAHRIAAPGEDFEKAWRRLLHDGVLPVERAPSEAVPSAARLADAVSPVSAGAPEGGDRYEIVFLAGPSTGDGRFANNPWLQETPDPMTKITWDNAAILGPAAAKALGVKTEEGIRVERDGRELELPVYILPGVARRTIALPLGYGRTAAGRVGNGVGADTYRIRTAGAPWIAPDAGLARTGRNHELAATQDHHLIDDRGAREREGRIGSLVREVEAADYIRDPERAMPRGHHPPLESLWKEHAYSGHSWGMTIDLNACTGCSACVVACQAENNIPVVGKEQVRRQREMSWIRIDRYFKGDPDDPEMVHQPVACVHCEMAPCEQVCPVAATVHTGEGLNAMVYNRCIGTRYCSNNCPYKVRRFNFFDYRKNLEPTEKMVFNPEVTVRTRGVMEKCTYCVQRIEAGKIAAKNEKRPVRDGEITPACAGACPTKAIVFGDLNDPESRVAKQTGSHRAYGMLAELNIKPHTNYLARVRNRNPELTEKGGHEPSHG